MFHDGRIGILGHRSEILDITVAEGIGDLERGAQQHREDEEDGHALLLEEREGAQSQRIDPRLLAHAAVDGACGQRERVDGQHERQRRRDIQLPGGEFDLHASDMHQIDDHMAAMNPTVPHTRMGGKCFTLSSFARSRAL